MTLVCLFLLFYLIGRLSRRYKWGCGKTLRDSIDKKLSRNTIISYLYYNWIKIGYATAPKAIDFVTGDENGRESFICFFTFTFLNIILPVIYVSTLVCNYDSLQFEETKAKYGVLYANVSLFYHDGGKKLTLRRKDIVLYPLIFCMRRTMFVLTCVIWT